MLGIALSVPPNSEFLFEPHKEINIEYIVHNGLKTELPVKAELGVSPELSDYVSVDNPVVTLAPESSAKVTIKVNLPDKMPYGLFGISFAAVDNAAVGGSFVAHVGVTNTVHIFNPYPTGTPHFEYKGPDSLPDLDVAELDLFIRNLGKTDLTDINIHAALLNGNTTASETYSDDISIPALQNTNLKLPFKIKAPSGLYKLRIDSKNKFIERYIQVGAPKVDIARIEKFSTDDWAVVMTLVNNWNKPLTEGTIAAIIKDPVTGAKLSEASATYITLQPGNNTITLRANDNQLPTGLLPVDLQILSPPYYITAVGEIEVEQGALGQMLEGKPLDTGEWITQLIAIDQPRMELVNKNKQLIGVLITLAIAIFLFSIAMLFRKRPENESET
ncbi:MAG TPA: hypothetical protein VI612_03840 [Candidatus Nanoarchaeia archaeon]|nr:hypothetical protein [Candidatus Nanoarchaeia archaeon]